MQGKAGTLQRELDRLQAKVASGDLEQWDLTVLLFALLNSSHTLVARGSPASREPA